MENKLNDKILNNVKLKISISNFEEEEKIEMKKNKKSIYKVAMIASCMIISITGIAFAKDIGTFIQNLFGPNSSDGVNTAVENGYLANVKTQYQNADGIEINVDSMLMDDFNFAMNFDVNVSEKYNIDEFESTFIEDLKITDETGKIVFNSTNAKFESEQKMQDEGYKGAYSFVSQKINDSEFKLSLSATGNPEVFPKSKHLKVEFTKIKTWSYIDEQEIDKIYEGNWNFEVDVPSEFYNREATIYKVTSCSEKGIDINSIKAVLSNTAFKISIPEIKTDKVDYKLLHTSTPKNISDMIALQKEYVETSNGKRFETSQRSDGDGGYGLPEGEDRIINYSQTFNLTKYDATDNLIVHIFTNKGEEIKIELSK